MSVFLALALVASTTVRVTEVEDVAQETAVAIATATAQAITHATTRACAVDDPAWPSCGDDAACAEKIRARTESDDVVFLSMLGSATLIRVVARRVGVSGGVVDQRLDLPREVALWDKALDGLAVNLFGKTEAPAGLIGGVQASPPPAGPRVLPWLVMGAGAAAVGVGVIFGQLSVATQRSFDDQPVRLPSDADSFASTKSAQAIGADVLFGVGGAIALTGLGMLIFGD